jgi:hypothetical protein
MVGNLWNGFNLGLLNPQSTWINYMTQMFHLIVKELTFANMKFYVMFFKSSKHLLQMMHMIS